MIIRCQFCNEPATYTLRRLPDDKRVPACRLCKSMASGPMMPWEAYPGVDFFENRLTNDVSSIAKG